MKTKNHENATRQPRNTKAMARPTPDWEVHILDELYRLVGLAPVHAYQAARADLVSLHATEGEEP